jgi:hypothetical protein
VALCIDLIVECVNLYQKINLLIYRVAELSDNGLAGVIIDRFGKDVMIVPAYDIRGLGKNIA